jgi:hypothetical protein
MNILFYTSQNTYILSEYVEDRLILQYLYDPKSTKIIYKSWFKIKNIITNVLDDNKQKVWRRFLRLYIEPLLKDNKRMELFKSRILIAMKDMRLERKIIDSDVRAEDLSSDDDDDKKKKKSKGKSFRKRKTTVRK